jgi:hypothetical protein
MTSFVLVIFALAMVLPGLAAAVTVFTVGPFGVIGPLAAMITGAAVLLAEAYGAARLLGRALDRMEPSAVG